MNAHFSCCSPCRAGQPLHMRRDLGPRRPRCATGNAGWLAASGSASGTLSAIFSER